MAAATRSRQPAPTSSSRSGRCSIPTGPNGTICVAPDPSGTPSTARLVRIAVEDRLSQQGAAPLERLLSIAVRLRAPRTVAVAREAAPGIRVTLESEQDASRDRGVGEVGEHAVHAEPVDLQIFVHRVAFVVRDQGPLLVAEGPRVHQQADLVRALDQVARRQELAARLARAGQAGGRRADDVALPRTDAVGVGFDLPQPG